MMHWRSSAAFVRLWPGTVTAGIPDTGDKLGFAFPPVDREEGYGVRWKQ